MRRHSKLRVVFIRVIFGLERKLWILLDCYGNKNICKFDNSIEYQIKRRKGLQCIKQIMRSSTGVK